ncbi:MAG: hypothetical protein M3R05_06020, partial [Chloroflexota bacterium]|nr:hypothetical protein [Chloroflexota bacterium]
PGALADPPVAAQPHGELVPIRIVTQDEVLDGWTRVGSERLSDLLNGEDMLSFSRVQDEPTEDDWQAIDRDRMLLVVAPPHTSHRQLRVNRQKRKIIAQSAHYAVLGTVHLIPGNRLDRTVLQTRQHFLPITNAQVVIPSRPDVEEEHEVVLLNIVNVDADLKLEVAD